MMELTALIALLRILLAFHGRRRRVHCLLLVDRQAVVNIWVGQSPRQEWLFALWCLLLDLKNEVTSSSMTVRVSWRPRRTAILRDADQAAASAYDTEDDGLPADLSSALLQGSQAYCSSPLVRSAPVHR